MQPPLNSKIIKMGGGHLHEHGHLATQESMVVTQLNRRFNLTEGSTEAIFSKLYSVLLTAMQIGLIAHYISIVNFSW